MNIVRIFAFLAIAVPTLSLAMRTPKTPEGRDIAAPRKKLAYERNKEESERAKKQAAFEEKQKNRKKRKRGVNPRLKTKHVTLRDMSPAQLRAAADARKAAKDFSGAIAFLEQLVRSGDDGFQDDKAATIIELADIYFENGDYEEASKKYNDFINIYPGNKAVEHASYRAIVCSSKHILSPDRDQSKTEETLALTSKFLERSDVFKTYQNEVHAIRQLCIQTLAMSELNVGAFYVNAGDFKAAQNRISRVRTEWLPKAPDIELTLANLELDLAERFPEFKPTAGTHVSGLTIASSNQPKKIDLTTRF